MIPSLSPFAITAGVLLAVGQNISMKSRAITRLIAVDKSLAHVVETMTMDVNDYYRPNILHAVQHLQESLKCISELCHEAREGEDISYLVNAASKIGDAAEILLPNRPTGDFPPNVISVDFHLKRRA